MPISCSCLLKFKRFPTLIFMTEPTDPCSSLVPAPIVVLAWLKPEFEKSKHVPLDRRPSEGCQGEDEWYSRMASAGESWRKKAGQR